MKTAVDRKQFQQVVRIVSMAADGGSGWPFPRRIRLRTMPGDQLNVEAFDLQLGIRAAIPAINEDEGEVNIVAEALRWQLAHGSEEFAGIESNDDSVMLHVDGALYTENQVGSDKWKDIPELQPIHELQIGHTDLRRILREVAFCPSGDDGKAILTGILIRIRPGMVTFVATDCYRLAVHDWLMETGVPEGTDFKAIVPARSIRAFLRIPECEGDCAIRLGDAHCQFLVGDYLLLSQQIEVWPEGPAFPTYERVLPEGDPPVSLVLKRRGLLGVLRRLAYVARQNAGRVGFDILSGIGLQLSAATEDRKIAETIACAPKKEILWPCNVNYLLDVLGSLADDEIRLDLWGETKPGRITVPDKNGWQYIVMPMY